MGRTWNPQKRCAHKEQEGKAHRFRSQNLPGIIVHKGRDVLSPWNSEYAFINFLGPLIIARMLVDIWNLI